ncbi:Fic family protein [Oceanospirillum beijerinckii]|uniref:Fic family protein n=1 Tax=Oceanospirillum beijerinckii TaxID=64976 RepID=UPI0004268958|nr:Fic family protein [Oceanospirillum beijerinckii]
MKMPLVPPSPDRLLDMLNKGDASLFQLLFSSDIGPCDDKGRYMHWDKLRHLTPPVGFTSELYWHAVKQARSKISKSFPFTDKYGKPFVYGMPDTVMRDILWISENATGALNADARIADDKTRNTYLINSLIEEAISSSQLEGASTTRKVAKEMIRSGRSPQDLSERMIYNNHQAMMFIREFRGEKLTPSMIFELHEILTEGTLEEGDRQKAGAFRTESDDIGVYSHDAQLLHTPPRAEELPERLQRLCDFANKIGEPEGSYIPPIIRAIIIHFMIGYDHPFVDGNGRTARALFYWVMSNEDYWLMEYLSISRVIKKSPTKYMYAYLYTETDGNDTTYFILHQLAAIREAIEDLHTWLLKKSEELLEAESVLEGSILKGKLNHRQLGILKNALENPGAEYTIKSHQNSHGIVYQTARTDLLKLSDDFGLLRKFKQGNKDVFIAPPNLVELVRKTG